MAAGRRIPPGEYALEIFSVFLRVVFLVLFGKKPGMSAAIPLAADVPPLFLAQCTTIVEIVVPIGGICLALGLRSLDFLSRAQNGDQEYPLPAGNFAAKLGR